MGAIFSFVSISGRPPEIIVPETLTNPQSGYFSYIALLDDWWVNQWPNEHQIKLHHIKLLTSINNTSHLNFIFNICFRLFLCFFNHSIFQKFQKFFVDFAFFKIFPKFKFSEFSLILSNVRWKWVFWWRFMVFTFVALYNQLKRTVSLL